METTCTYRTNCIPAELIKIAVKLTNLTVLGVFWKTFTPIVQLKILTIFPSSNFKLKKRSLNETSNTKFAFVFFSGHSYLQCYLKKVLCSLIVLKTRVGRPMCLCYFATFHISSDMNCLLLSVIYCGVLLSVIYCGVVFWFKHEQFE